MRTTRSSAIALFLGVLIAGAQASTRDFLASFRYSNPITAGDQVQVKVSVRLWNKGSQDLAGGTLVIHELRDQLAEREAFRGIHVVHKTAKVLQGYVTISSDEYKSWTQGNIPRFTLQFVDQDGVAHEYPVDTAQAMGDNDEN